MIAASDVNWQAVKEEPRRVRESVVMVAEVGFRAWAAACWVRVP